MLNQNLLPVYLRGGLLVGILILVVWSLVWKAFALWRAARNDSKWWYGVMLVVNTAGILDILYLFVFGKRKQPQQPQG